MCIWSHTIRISREEPPIDKERWKLETCLGKPHISLPSCFNLEMHVGIP